MKTIITLGVLIAIIATLPMAVLATEKGVDTLSNYDSLKISDEVKQQLGVNAFEKVIKIYNVAMFQAFSEVHSIDELLESKGLILSEYYAVQSTGGALSYKSIIDNVAVDLTGNAPMKPKAKKTLLDNTVVTKISSDIEVYKTYYLSGENCRTGTAIYYKTNKGDFVYYDHYEIGNSEYLFPIKDFCEFQQAIRAEKAKYADLDGGVDLSGVWNLSKYDINADSFAPLSNTKSKDGEKVNNKEEIIDAGTTPSTPTNTDKTNPTEIYWWVGISCVAVLVIVGVVLGTRKIRKKPAADTAEKGSTA